MDLVLMREGLPLEATYPYDPLSNSLTNICKDTNIFTIQNNYRMSYFDIINQDIIK